MKAGWRGLGVTMWRLAASFAALVAIVEVGKRSKALEPSEVSPRRESGFAPRERPSSDASPVLMLEMADFPMAMNTRAVVPCDARVWSPQDMPEWTSSSWLLDLDRGQDRVTAVWLELDGEQDGDSGWAVGRVVDAVSNLDSAPAQTVVYHSMQLECAPDGRGTLHHTWILARDGLGLRDGVPVGPLAVDQRPVPLLSGCERRLRFQSFGWWIFVDEPEDAASVLPRFETAMVAGGWRRHVPPPVLTSGRAAGQVFAKQDFAGRFTEGLILRRGSELCLVSHTPIEDREMLITACLGLTNTAKPRSGQHPPGES